MCCISVIIIVSAALGEIFQLEASFEYVHLRLNIVDLMCGTSGFIVTLSSSLFEKGWNDSSKPNPGRKSWECKEPPSCSFLGVQQIDTLHFAVRV